MEHLTTNDEKFHFVTRQLFSKLRGKLTTIFNLREQVEVKEDGALVTESDIYINQLLCEEYRVACKIIDKDKNFNIISEEVLHDDSVDYNDGYTLIIDPIDGTENFFSGMAEWGICICIYKDGMHHYSAIILPELNKMIDSTLKIKRKMNSRVVGLSSSLKAEDLVKVMEERTDDEEYRIIGCAAYNLYSFITGAYKRFENVKGVNTWDVSAGLNIMLANGIIPIVNDEVYLGELLLPVTKYKLNLR